MNVEFCKCIFSIYENNHLKFIKKSINMVYQSGSKQKIKTTQQVKQEKFNNKNFLTVIRISVRYKKALYGFLELTKENPRKEELIKDRISFEKVWFSLQIGEFISLAGLELLSKLQKPSGKQLRGSMLNHINKLPNSKLYFYFGISPTCTSLLIYGCILFILLLIYHL